MEIRRKSVIEERIFESRLPRSADSSLMFTPLLDVFFLLLIFIALGASKVHSPGIMVEPPAVDEQMYEYADKLVVTMDSLPREDGTYDVQIFFNDQSIPDYNKLENELVKIAGETRDISPLKDLNARLPIVLLTADKHVPLDATAQVMSICRNNNLRLFIFTQEK